MSSGPLPTGMAPQLGGSGIAAYAQQYQIDKPPEVEQSIKQIEARVADARDTIKEVLYMLELEYKVRWPELLEKMSSLSNAMSTIQVSLRKSGISTVKEDYGALLRSHVMVPSRLQYEPDEALMEMTQGRVHSFHHDLVPDYLRTKADTELEKEEERLETERSLKGMEFFLKQVQNYNRHIDLLITSFQRDTDKQQAESSIDKPTCSAEETARLVRTIYVGEGLKVQRSSAAAAPTASGSAEAAAAARQQIVMQQHPSMYGHQMGMMGGAPGGMQMAGGQGTLSQMGGPPGGPSLKR